MGMQTQVYRTTAPGVAGDPATPDQMVYQPINFTAEGDVTVGNFVFPSTTAPETHAVAAGTGEPLGLVQRELNHFNYDLTSPGTLVLPEGSTLAVAVRGDFWVVTTTAATVGQAVFASETDGSISTDDAGATVSGSVETKWRVKTAGDANDLIIISAWA